MLQSSKSLKAQLKFILLLTSRSCEVTVRIARLIEFFTLPPSTHNQIDLFTAMFFSSSASLLAVAGTNNLQQQQKPPQFHESDIITDASFASTSIINSKCKGNAASSKSRIANETTPIHMNSNNSSIISSRTTNNQQLAPGASSNQVYNQQQQNISQYGNNNNYSNQNNLSNNFNMVAAGQQSGMDVGYNSQVRNLN